jgi:nucleotide-binding universal stress UspA family protein
MYKKILLAYDGTLEGRHALREGALIAKNYNAEVFLLSIMVTPGGVTGAESIYPEAVSNQLSYFKAVLDDGIARLKKIGIEPVVRMVNGDPRVELGKFAKEVRPDLLVIGYRQRPAVERWLFGSTASLMTDVVDCSILVGRNEITDIEFEQLLAISR